MLYRNDLIEMSLHFDFDHGPSRLDPAGVSWSIFDGADGLSKAPRSACHRGPRTLYRADHLFADLRFPAAPRQTVNRLKSRWLHGRLTTPMAPGGDWPVPGGTFPGSRALTVSAVLEREDLHIGRAFADAAPLDTTRDFFPFGERPKLADALYLLAGDAFTVAGAKVTLKIEPTAGTTPYVGAEPKLVWEYWIGAVWVEVGSSTPTSSTPATDPDSRTAPSRCRKKATSRSSLGPQPAMHALNGVDGYWMRVRITEGSYGGDASYVPIDAKDLAKLPLYAADFRATLARQGQRRL